MQCSVEHFTFDLVMIPIRVIDTSEQLPLHVLHLRLPALNGRNQGAPRLLFLVDHAMMLGTVSSGHVRLVMAMSS